MSKPLIKLGTINGYRIYSKDPHIAEYDGFWSNDYRNLTDFLNAKTKEIKADLEVFVNENLELEVRRYKPYL